LVRDKGGGNIEVVMIIEGLSNSFTMIFEGNGNFGSSGSMEESSNGFIKKA
jgi:hypothetical protein